MRRAILTLACLVLPSAAAAQDKSDEEWLEQCRSERWSKNRQTVCDVQVHTIAARDVVRVRPGNNGGVYVVAEDRRDVEVHVRVQASARDRNRAEQLVSAVRAQLGNTISADAPAADDDSNWSTSFYIHVPRNTNLDLQTHNGPVGVKDVIGKMELSTQNGPINLSGAGGDVRARTQNGPISVRLTGSRWNGARLDAEASNGPISLSIPEQYAAQLEVGTTNGPFRTDFPINVTLGPATTGKYFKTELGTGGAPIRVVTMNGPLSLHRN